MAVEKAQYVKELDKDLPLGGDSLSEGDDHIRLIKETLTGSFPNIDSAVTATPADLNDVANIRAELDALEAGSHGNVGSCYFNPDFTGGVDGVTGLVYGHNVSDIVEAGTSELPQTRIIFDESAFPDLGDVAASHFAFNITPLDGSGAPVILKITSAADTYVGFMAWKLNGGTWETMPAKSCGFTLVVVDMDASQ